MPRSRRVALPPHPFFCDARRVHSGSPDERDREGRPRGPGFQVASLSAYRYTFKVPDRWTGTGTGTGPDRYRHRYHTYIHTYIHTPVPVPAPVPVVGTLQATLYKQYVQ